MRRPHAATVAAVLLLWLAALTFAFHGRILPVRGTLVVNRNSASLPRKMLLAVTSFHAAASPSSTEDGQQERRPHHHHHQHHHRHQHHQQHHRPHHHHHHHGQWNRQGIPPPFGKHGEIDPRYGVEKRIVPTGPNPLHH